MLQSLIRTVHHKEDKDLRRFSRWDGLVDWERIVGYKSLAEWVSAGARHPRYRHLPSKRTWVGGDAGKLHGPGVSAWLVGTRSLVRHIKKLF